MYPSRCDTHAMLDGRNSVSQIHTHPSTHTHAISNLRQCGLMSFGGLVFSTPSHEFVASLLLLTAIGPENALRSSDIKIPPIPWQDAACWNSNVQKIICRQTFAC